MGGAIQFQHAPTHKQPPSARRGASGLLYAVAGFPHLSLQRLFNVAQGQSRQSLPCAASNRSSRFQAASSALKMIRRLDGRQCTPPAIKVAGLDTLLSRHSVVAAFHEANNG